MLCNTVPCIQVGGCYVSFVQGGCCTSFVKRWVFYVIRCVGQCCHCLCAARCVHVVYWLCSWLHPTASIHLPNPYPHPHPAPRHPQTLTRTHARGILRLPLIGLMQRLGTQITVPGSRSACSPLSIPSVPVPSATNGPSAVATPHSSTSPTPPWPHSATPAAASSSTLVC